MQNKKLNKLLLPLFMLLLLVGSVLGETEASDLVKQDYNFFDSLKELLSTGSIITSDGSSLACSFTHSKETTDKNGDGVIALTLNPALDYYIQLIDLSTSQVINEKQVSRVSSSTISCKDRCDKPLEVLFHTCDIKEEVQCSASTYCDGDNLILRNLQTCGFDTYNCHNEDYTTSSGIFKEYKCGWDSVKNDEACLPVTEPTQTTCYSCDLNWNGDENPFLTSWTKETVYSGSVSCPSGSSKEPKSLNECYPEVECYTCIGIGSVAKTTTRNCKGSTTPLTTDDCGGSKAICENSGGSLVNNECVCPTCFIESNGMCSKVINCDPNAPPKKVTCNTDIDCAENELCLPENPDTFFSFTICKPKDVKVTIALEEFKDPLSAPTKSELEESRCSSSDECEPLGDRRVRCLAIDTIEDELNVDIKSKLTSDLSQFFVQGEAKICVGISEKQLTNQCPDSIRSIGQTILGKDDCGSGYLGIAGAVILLIIILSFLRK